MNTQTKYHFFGDRSKARTIVITFATVKESNSNIVKFSFSCSNINDIFDKAYGKMKALARINSTNLSFEFELDSETISEYRTVNNYLANFVLDNLKLFPSWAKNIVKRNV